MRALVPALDDVVRGGARWMRASGRDHLHGDDFEELPGGVDLIRDRALATMALYGWDVETAKDEAMLLVEHCLAALHHEAHGRKTFWFDGALAWMLRHTRPDLPGERLELPYPSFALAFTDREVLGFLETALTDEGTSRLAGRTIEIVTVYVTELPGEDGRREIRLCFLCDAQDGEWPYLLSRDLAVGPGDDLEAIADSRAAGVVARGPPPDPFFRSREMRELVRLVLNGILYITNGVEAAQVLPAAPRPRAPRGRSRAPVAPAYTSSSVYHLPGTIDMRVLREREASARKSGGTASQRFERCFVRGHWRRPSPQYRDQRLRWIAPHWRGPDGAPTVERPHRVLP